jgi:glycerol-3-phosphate dehydrogenase
MIVVGGGIYGCMLALETARRGLRPLLLERDDFGQHTSGSWLRVLHGGLRYLQTLDLPRHLESVRARRWFLRHFPDLVEPLQCVMPLYGRGLRRRWPMAGALTADRTLSWYRNHRVRGDRILSRGRTLSSNEVLRLGPSIRTDGLEGGALWYDAVTRRPQRLLMEILRWAVAEGAQVVNHVEVVGLERDGDRATGVRAVDRVTGGDLTLTAPVVVNCAGPWSERVAGVLGGGGREGLFIPSMAFNVLFDREADFEGALGVEARHPGARTYFAYPAYGGILAGTYHAPGTGGGAGTGKGTGTPDGEDLDTFRSELDEAMPGLGISSASMLHVFSGRLPARRRGTVELSRHPVIRHHGDHGGPVGLVSVSGVKFTTARQVALRVISALERRGHVSVGEPSSRPRPDPVVVPDPEALAETAPDRLSGLVRWFVSSEAAGTVDDVLFRRTGWGFDPRAPDTLRRLVDEALSDALPGLNEGAP